MNARQLKAFVDTAIDTVDETSEAEVRVLDTEYGEYLFPVREVRMNGKTVVIVCDMEGDVEKLSGRWG